MSDNTNTTTNESLAEPTLSDLIFFAKMSPTGWFHLSEAQRDEWKRLYLESGVEPGAVERAQGRGRRAK